MYFLALLEKKFPRGCVRALAGHMYTLAIFLTHATNLFETLACLYLLDSESPLAFFFLVIGFEPVVDGYIKLRLGDTKTPVDDFVYATVVQIFEACTRPDPEKRPDAELVEDTMNLGLIKFAMTE